jgi:hypothetical protein
MCQIMVSSRIAGGIIGDKWLATLAAQVTWALLGIQRFWTEHRTAVQMGRSA